MTQHQTVKSIPKIPVRAVESAASGDVLPRYNLRIGVLGMLLVGLVALFVIRIAVGSARIPIADIVMVLTGGEASKSSWTVIVINHRLPRAITAVLAGAALSVSGLMMQTLFRNPLAGPFVLGVSSGASLGVALVVLTSGTIGGTLLAGVGLGLDVGTAMASGLGAGLTMLIVVLVASRVRSAMTLLILGLMFGYMTSAMVSLLLYFSIPEQIQAYIRWTFGSFGGVSWSEMRVLAPAVMIGLFMAFSLSKSLNALLLGETYAASMGLRVMRTQVLIVISTALLTGVVTAFCGPIGFVGVAVPHLCRSLFNTSDHRLLVPASMIVGAITALVAALIAQVPGSESILPLNPVTAIIGAPVVISVIMRQRNLHKTFAA